MRLGWHIVTVLSAACSMALGQKTPQPGPYVGHKVVRVTVESREQLDQALEIATTSWNCEVGHGPLDLQVTDEQLADLRKIGLEPVVIVPDVQAVIDAERAEIEAARAAADATWFSTFRTMTEINTRLDYYAATYPNLATVSVAGQSIEGRDIKVISITGPDLPGNPRAMRPAVIFNACQHAREWAVPMTAMWIADRLIESYGTDPRLTDYVNRLEFLIVPVVNPDGYEFSWTPNNRLWRKNKRRIDGVLWGVDNNRNWGYQWGGMGAETYPGGETYRGEAAWSEPENQAMRDLFLANPRLRAHIDFHSATQMVMSPWGYTSQPHPIRGLYSQFDSAIASAIFAVHGTQYTFGPVYSTIYPVSGGSIDWTAGDRGVLGYTIEVRGSYGFVMPVSEIIPNAEENFEGALALCDFALLPLIGESVNRFPTTVVADGSPTPVALWVLNSQFLAQAPTLWARVNGGAWVPSLTSPIASNTHQGMLPGVTYCQDVEFYFEAVTLQGQTLTVPAGGAAAPRLARATGSRVVFFDELEQDSGWTVGSPTDTATAGVWSRCDPEQTTAQPADDHSPAGTIAWITDCRAGANANTYDVDGGRTSLTSPLINTRLLSMQVREGRLTFWTWRYRSSTSDAFQIQVSGDGGQSWFTVASITSPNTSQWERREYVISDLNLLTSQTRIRFVAQDISSDSLVEAGVDDVMLEMIGCERDIDYNADGAINGFDLECLSQAVAGDLSCTILDPDFNGDGMVNPFDVSELELAIAGG